jgi:hypothetical protein
MWEKIVAWNINVKNIVCATNETKNVQWVEESGKTRKECGKNELWLKKKVNATDRKIDVTKMNNCKKKINEILTTQRKEKKAWNFLSSMTFVNSWML